MDGDKTGKFGISTSTTNAAYYGWRDVYYQRPTYQLTCNSTSTQTLIVVPQIHEIGG